MAIKTPFKIDKIAHAIVGLMIFLWAWVMTNVEIAFVIILIVGILKEVFDKYFKIPILKWFISKGFYQTTVGRFLAKNRFIMPEMEVINAIPLFDVMDIVFTVAIPALILVISKLFF